MRIFGKSGAKITRVMIDQSGNSTCSSRALRILFRSIVAMGKLWSGGGFGGGGGGGGRSGWVNRITYLLTKCLKGNITLKNSFEKNKT